ncbi:MAG: hypothetical protein DGJ47_000759 [Rickettsiaceae bacterium]
MSSINLLQQKASNPESSIWVSASAGTGKTKILTDRVLRLLLKKQEFNKILCLTFTNAAAAEMKERITNAIFKWSIMEQDQLRLSVEAIQGRCCSSDDLMVAKNLYKEYLHSENNVNVQTIHSFCQKLLKRFPLEASISPSFQIIDENKERNILSEIKNILIQQEVMQPINEYLATNFHDLIIDEIFSEIIQYKTKFLNDSPCTINLHKESKNLVLKLENIDFSKFDYLYQIELLRKLLGDNFDIKHVRNFFLTAKGDKKKKIVNAKVAKPGSPIYEELLSLQNRFYETDQLIKNEQLNYFAQLIKLLSSQLLQEYEKFKQQKGLLDYDDLIEKACALLKDSEAREWVLYKMDGFINHLLVDEAQDTSPNQWSIINALITEFYSGEGQGSDLDRTIFVVGDAKQSIFSFQGADVSVFAQTNITIAQKMYYAQKEFSNIDLEISYRSTQEVLDVVSQLFTKLHQDEGFQMPITFLRANRGSGGLVELWPLCENKEEEKERFWPTSCIDSESAKARLANKIAVNIKQMLEKKTIMPSTNQPVRPEDIMILFRKRDDLVSEVIEALQSHGVSVSGLDRIVLKDNLSIQDLLAAARFALNPDDNLNLASLIRSPVIDVNHLLLEEMSTRRDGRSIWKFLTHHADHDKYREIYEKLLQIRNLHLTNNSIGFFSYLTDIMGARQALNACNGSGSDDAINELLYSCHSYVSHFDDSLQNFTSWLDDSESSVKRENLIGNQVRIMTTHAAKGLQAPVVIMCDTTSLPTNKERFFWSSDGSFISSKHAGDASNNLNYIKQKSKEKIYQEYLRLLYVAMTRAEDHLIICGYQGGRSVPDNCWYYLIQNAMQIMESQVFEDKLLYGKLQGECLGTKQNNKESSIDKRQFFTPGEINNIPEPDLVLMPDNLEEWHDYLSPLFNANPLEYGIAFHKILEDAIGSKNLSNMSQHPLIGTLSPKDQKRMLNSVDKILINTEFYDIVTNKEVSTEVNIGSIEEGSVDLRRIDLISCDHNQKSIVIIDYKSDFKPAKSYSEVPVIYIEQMKKYKEFCTKIYPNYQIKCKILWLENGEMTSV